RPVKLGALHRPAEGFRLLEVERKAACVHQKLLRHAATDDAGAADAVLLGDHDARAMLGGDARGAHAARPAADDEQIDVELRHWAPLRGAQIVCPRFFISARRLWTT